MTFTNSNLKVKLPGGFQYNSASEGKNELIEVIFVVLGGFYKILLVFREKPSNCHQPMQFKLRMGGNAYLFLGYLLGSFLGNLLGGGLFL